MKKILLHYIENAFNDQVRDNCTQPFIYLQAELKKIGYSLELSNQQVLSEVTWVFFINFENVFPYRGIRASLRLLRDLLRGRVKRDLYHELQQARQTSKAVLFLWEGPTVSAASYQQSFLKKFKHIFSWHDDLVAERGFYKFHLPVPSSIGSVINPGFNQRSLLTAISWNKSSKAEYAMYQFRKDEMTMMARYLGNDFQFYGRDWDKLVGDERQLLLNYGGPVANKIEVLPNFRFSLCYENVFGLPGYVTEKIFDIMRCGVVPIYKGAANIHDYIPSNCFINRDDFESSEALADYLRSVTESEFADYLKNISHYLQSDQFKCFLPEYFAANIIDRLNNFNPR